MEENQIGYAKILKYGKDQFAFAKGAHQSIGQKKKNEKNSINTK